MDSNTTSTLASPSPPATIARSTDVDQTEYERFLDGFAPTPGAALAYHYAFYLRFLSEHVYPGSTRRFVVARDAAGAMVGVIPALHVRTPNVNVWLSLAYFGPNAGAIVAGAATPDGRATTQALVAAAVADARELGCDSMTLHTPLNAPTDPYRAGLGGADFELERVSQTLAIVPTDGTAGASPWPRKVRYDVRRSESLGVSVRPVASEAELDHVWDIYQRHCADVGIPVKPLACVRQLYRTAGQHGIFLVAEQGGEIVAGLICLVGGGVLSYYLPCTRPESRSLQPGLLLLDRAVAMARAAGCRLLNFEASPAVEDSVYKFKARCGGTPVPYRVFVKLLTPGALDTYRALGAAAISEQVPQAFIVPFPALA